MIRELFDKFHSHEKQLYVVGGAVRDMVRGAPYERWGDIDFTTDATPEEIMQILGRFHIFRTNREFGTLSFVYHDGKQVDITPYRAQSYRGPSPLVTPELQPLAHDLSHRDFTINAIAMNRYGVYIDPFGGQDDIRRGVIRAVNNTPEEMLREHPVRSLRCVRFVSTFGYQVDAELFDAIQNLGYLLDSTPPEMVKEEMDKLLVGDYVTNALQIWVDSTIAAHILPEIVATCGLKQPDIYHDRDVWEHIKATVGDIKPVGTRPYHILRWAALLHDVGKPETKSSSEGGIHFYGHEKRGAELFEQIAKRLRFSNEERRIIMLLILNHLRPAQYSHDWGDSSVRRFAYECRDYLGELLEVSRTDVASHRPEVANEKLQLIEELKTRIKSLEGKDAIKVQLPKGIGDAIMGAFELKPGPEVGKLRKTLEEAIIKGELPSGLSSEECIEFLRKAR